MLVDSIQETLDRATKRENDQLRNCQVELRGELRREIEMLEETIQKILGHATQRENDQLRKCQADLLAAMMSDRRRLAKQTVFLRLSWALVALLIALAVGLAMSFPIQKSAWPVAREGHALHVHDDVIVPPVLADSETNSVTSAHTTYTDTTTKESVGNVLEDPTAEELPSTPVWSIQDEDVNAQQFAYLGTGIVAVLASMRQFLSMH